MRDIHAIEQDAVAIELRLKIDTSRLSQPKQKILLVERIVAVDRLQGASVLFPAPAGPSMAITGRLRDAVVLAVGCFAEGWDLSCIRLIHLGWV
jgi:hypothetical protein